MIYPALRHRACPLCGSHDAQPEVECRQQVDDRTLEELRPFWFGIEKERHFFTYHRCAGCGLLYNRVFFDDAQLAELYSAMPPNMDQVAGDAVAATQRGYFSAVARQGPLAGGYLEIGPDVGYIVAEAVRRGDFDRFWLFEPNRAVHGRLELASAGCPTIVLPDMTDLSAVPDGTIGLAVMVHVLDHLLAPLEMLEAILPKMRPGGRLLAVTHNERSLLRGMMGTRWPPFCLQHPELYNSATIYGLMERAGFTDIMVTGSTNHFPIDFLGRQALLAAGLGNVRLPLPKHSIGLRLGNMLTLATAPAQAAEARPRTPLESWA